MSKRRSVLLAAALAVVSTLGLGSAAQAVDVVTESRKLINVIGVSAELGFGYVALFERDTSGCGGYELLTVGMGTEAERLVFSTLLAAKTANRAVTVTFDRDDGCTVSQAHIH